MGESYKHTTRSRGRTKNLSGLTPLHPLTNMVQCNDFVRTTMKTRMIIAVVSLGLFAAWPTTATPPYTAIVIDSGSPYFVPKSATVSSGVPDQMGQPHGHRSYDHACGLYRRWERLRIRLRNRQAERQLYACGIASGPLPLSLPASIPSCMES